MLGRVVAGTMASIGLLCATVAWTGWVYLHTIGDPHRTEEIAAAVLDTPEARAEIADVLADQLIERAGIPRDTAPTISTAVEDVLADPRIARNLIDAFGSEHARALGVDDPRPTTIDTQAIIAAAEAHLAVAAPSIAAALQGALGVVAVEPLELPDLHTDSAGRVRDAADAATTSLAIVAAALLVAAFVVGDRRHVVRRIGTWGVFSGIGWLAGPYLVAAAAKQMSDFDATIDAIRGAVQGPVITGAIVLVAGGAAALVAWVMPIWGSPSTAPTRAGGSTPAPPAARWGQWPARRPGETVVMPVTSTSATAPAPAAARADTFQWSGQQPTYQQAAYQQPTYQHGRVVQPADAPPTQVRPAAATQTSPLAASGPSTEAIWGVTRPSAAASAGSGPTAGPGRSAGVGAGSGAPAGPRDDQDPWSIYFGEAQREK